MAPYRLDLPLSVFARSDASTNPEQHYSVGRHCAHQLGATFIRVVHKEDDSQHKRPIQCVEWRPTTPEGYRVQPDARYTTWADLFTRCVQLRNEHSCQQEGGILST